MHKTHQRDIGHTLLKLAACLLPLLLASGCSSGTSGRGPGLAGGQTLSPGTSNFPMAYIKRPVAMTDIDVRDQITPTAGGDLYIRDQAGAGGLETNITASITKGTGDVKDLDVSPDGKKLLFALRLALLKNAKEAAQPTWKIYQYDAVAKTVSQLTTDAVTKGHDIGPHYLPDGRIVFASTRQVKTQAILLDEGRPQYQAQTGSAADTKGNKQPIFALHVMNADGTDIHQISFNSDHDFAPSVMNNGQILFSRWQNVGGTQQISLYRTNPDGTGLELLYGANSHATGVDIAGTNTNVIQFIAAHQRKDGRLIAIDRPFLGTQLGGDIVTIDAQGFVEINQPAAPGNPAGTAQTSATTLGITTDAKKPSQGGRFASAYPLYDGSNRLIVSWAPCLVLDSTVTPTATRVCDANNTGGANVKEAPPQYTIWIYDLDLGTLSPLLSAQNAMVIVEPIILQARNPVPTFIADATPTVGAAKTLADNNLGLLVIRSVYDFDGIDTVAAQTKNALPNIAALADPKQATADQRPARFIRIQKAVEIPNKDVRKINNSAFGPAGMGMREILAYAPVEPDGSVKIEVPANVPFIIDVLDKNARRVGVRHSSWMQLMPGETRSCNGCHSTANVGNTPNMKSHGRSGLTASVNTGATGGEPFANTLLSLQPNAGDIMAETLARTSCPVPANCSQLPGPNVMYSDLWTDPVKAGRPQDLPFSYLYANLMTPAPSNANCRPWGAICRITIHYLQHIQPLWKLPRQTFMADMVTVATDHTCVLCHNQINAANALQVPAGQLDLTGGASTQDPTVVTSYRQLLFPHNQQTLNMGALQDLLVPAPGPPDPVTGAPTTIMVPATLAPPMAAGSANDSGSFFGVFDGTIKTPTTDHTGYLSQAELRLISEWLDIGAQYYNDPFVAPAAN